MVEHISVSQITTWLSCSRRYAYRYVEKAPRERRSVALAVGSAVHAAIAWLLEERMAGERPEVEAVVAELDGQWAAELGDGGFEEDVGALQQQHEVARGLVRAFHGTQPDLVPDDVEARMVVDLVDPRTLDPLPVPLLAYADAIFGDEVIELKTTSRKGSPWRWRLQLAAYSLAFRQLRGFRPRVRVVQLVKNREPSVRVDAVEVAERDELRFLEIAAEVLDAVHAGVFVANPSWMCRRCEYRGRCGSAA